MCYMVQFWASSRVNGRFSSRGVGPYGPWLSPGPLVASFYRVSHFSVFAKVLGLGAHAQDWWGFSIYSVVRHDADFSFSSSNRIYNFTTPAVWDGRVEQIQFNTIFPFCLSTVFAEYLKTGWNMNDRFLLGPPIIIGTHLCAKTCENWFNRTRCLFLLGEDERDHLLPNILNICDRTIIRMSSGILT